MERVMKAGIPTVLFTNRICKEAHKILASNSQARLIEITVGTSMTIDYGRLWDYWPEDRYSVSTGPKYSSMIKYILKEGKSFIWVPEKDLPNGNKIDERGWIRMSVSSAFPGPIANILESMQKLPTCVTMAGHVIPLTDEKAELAMESVEEVIRSEQMVRKKCSVLRSSSHISFSRGESLKELLGGEKYQAFGFNRNEYCSWTDSNGDTFGAKQLDLEKIKVDPLASYSAMLIDGVNQSEAMRRALVVLCAMHMDVNAVDAFLTSVDCKGFDVLVNVAERLEEYEWKEFRFALKNKAPDVETFCQLLDEMQETGFMLLD